MRDILLYSNSKNYSRQYLTEGLYAGDSGYRLAVRFDKNIDGAAVEALIKRSDGSIVTYYGCAEGHTAYAELNYSATALPGEWIARVRVIDVSGCVTICEAEGVVAEAMEGEAVSSDDRLPILTTLIAEVSEMQKEALAQDAMLNTLSGRLTEAEDTLEAHGERLIVTANNLTAHGGRLDTAEDTLEAHGGRLDTAEGKLTAHDSRLILAGNKLAVHDNRLDTAEDALEAHGIQLGGLTFSVGVNGILTITKED